MSVFMLNRTHLLKVSKIVLKIRTADIPLTVKLPQKSEYKNISDNFVPARNRLLSLLECFSKNPQQLKRYDTIIKDQERRDGVIESVDNPEVIRYGGTLYARQRSS